MSFYEYSLLLASKAQEANLMLRLAEVYGENKEMRDMYISRFREAMRDLGGKDGK
jgi:hypothetical protein